MGFRFRKRIRLGKGVYLNLRKKSSSLSIGGRGSTMNISKKSVRNTVRVPRTGISYQTKRVGACLGIRVREQEPPQLRADRYQREILSPFLRAES